MPPVRDRYMNDKILTATPTELIQMLLDRCVVEMTVAQERLTAGARPAATPHLRKAQDIVSELRSSLRLDAGELAANLDAIYAFAYRELVEAQLTGTTRLDGATRALAEIRDGWRDAFTPAGAAGSLAVGGQGPGQTTVTSARSGGSLAVGGQGPGQTTITSPGTAGNFVADLSQADRTTNVADSGLVAG